MKNKNLVISIVFIAYILLFAIGSIIVKDRAFSDMENRNLTMFPELSFKTIAKGEFMDKFETYMSDQIILKDDMVKLSNSVKSITNQKLLNDVYFADSDMIIQNYEYDEKNLRKNMKAVNDFAEEHEEISVTWFIAPTASYIYKDKLPKNAICDNQKLAEEYLEKNVSEKINFVSAFDMLEEHSDEYVYYRTDHHWTEKGAYYGYTVLCDALSLEAVPETCYTINEPSKAFYGSLYSKAPTFNVNPDSIHLYENEAGKYHVDYLDEDFSLDSLYNYENLLIKDKYTTYLDGNHSLIRITSNAEDKEPVLVIKDSYAHALLPFLADNYGDIHVIDLRYYHKSVSEYCSQNGITKVIFINNADFVTTDKNFSWLY